MRPQRADAANVVGAAQHSLALVVKVGGVLLQQCRDGYACNCEGLSFFSNGRGGGAGVLHSQVVGGCTIQIRLLGVSAAIVNFDIIVAIIVGLAILLPQQTEPPLLALLLFEADHSLGPSLKVSRLLLPQPLGLRLLSHSPRRLRSCFGTLCGRRRG